MKNCKRLKIFLIILYKKYIRGRFRYNQIRIEKEAPQWKNCMPNSV